MADIFTGRNTDYDGSGSPATATGSIIVTYSGTGGSGPKSLTLMSRSDTASYVATFNQNKFGRYKVNLANGDDFYFVAQCPADGSIDLSWTAA